MDIEKQTESEKQVTEELIRQIVESSPYAEFMGMKLIKAKDGGAAIEMMVKKHHENTQGIIHGGAICSLVDQVGPVALATKLGPNQRPRTVQIDIHYLAPGRGNRLIAEGAVSKTGRRISVIDCEVFDEEGATVALARCTCTIVNI